MKFKTQSGNTLLKTNPQGCNEVPVTLSTSEIQKLHITTPTWYRRKLIVYKFETNHQTNEQHKFLSRIKINDFPTMESNLETRMELTRSKLPQHYRPRNSRVVYIVPVRTNVWVSITYAHLPLVGTHTARFKSRQ